MSTYIALLRGINVGGNNKLAMRELVAILNGLGFRAVRTYIQSGNAVFSSDNQDAAYLSAAIGSEIKRRFAFEPHILVLQKSELEQAVKANPFPEAETHPETLHLNFMAATAANPNLQALEAIRKESERFQLIERVFYLHAPEGIGRSKLAAQAEKRLGVVVTGRNWRTVKKLLELAAE